ncbi:MAG TPA: hypothetical protein VGM80_03245 [Gaiellaceae bacterium]|jgi:hypothetical protein
MAIGLYITAPDFTIEKYDTTLAQLEAAGAGAPDGRQHHFALEVDGGIAVFDVWESMEQFEAFGETLIPILAAAGVHPDKPMVSEIHNTIAG